MDVQVWNMIRRALRQLAGYTTPTEREARVAQFAKIRAHAESYALGVKALTKYLEKLKNGEVAMTTDCFYKSVKQGWDAYLVQALSNICEFTKQYYEPWMVKFQLQEAQCAEVARDLVIIGTLKQMLKLWPAYKMSDCVLGTDYRADQEAAYGTPYAAAVTDINNPEKMGDNAPIDAKIWRMVTAIEMRFDELIDAVDALE